jgi:sugar phosphate isomerase/epimerase
MRPTRSHAFGVTRRELIATTTALGSLGLWSSMTAATAAPVRSQTPAWGSQIGFALFTVRTQLAENADRTMAAIAAMGVREVQPRTYLGLSFADFRALLDRHGLTCHSTHEFSIPGPNLERELEALAAIGIRYARFPLPGVTPPGSGRGRGAAAAAPPPGGRGRGAGGAGIAGMVETHEMMKRTAEDLNRQGAIARRFGVKALYHNHTTEFQRYPGEPLLPYEVLLAETDPELVAMEIDLGWAAVAGHDIVATFQAHPGRFELWHVKDAFGLRHLTPSMNQLERRANIMLVPVGLGEVDYRSYFAEAEVAGLKHFYIEQDNADAWGDAMAATRISVENLKKLLG